MKTNAFECISSKMIQRNKGRENRSAKTQLKRTEPISRRERMKGCGKEVGGRERNAKEKKYHSQTSESTNKRNLVMT